MLSSAALDEKSDMTEGRVVLCRILEWGWVGLWSVGVQSIFSLVTTMVTLEAKDDITQ